MQALGIRQVEAIGHLHALWWWCLDNAPDGRVRKEDYAGMAAAALWDGDPSVFGLGLLEAGFADGGDGEIVIHDWPDYVGKLLEARQKNAQKQQRWRDNNRHATDMKEERNRNVTVTVSDEALSGFLGSSLSSPEPNVDGDVTVTSPSRNWATVPNPTVPNHVLETSGDPPTSVPRPWNPGPSEQSDRPEAVNSPARGLSPAGEPIAAGRSSGKSPRRFYKLLDAPIQIPTAPPNGSTALSDEGPSAEVVANELADLARRMNLHREPSHGPPLSDASFAAGAKRIRDVLKMPPRGSNGRI